MGGGFKVKPSTQYKEYERAALADGRETIKLDGQAEEGEDWTILAIINPCNPTGEYMDISRLKEYIETQIKSRKPHQDAATGVEGCECVVLVDESMQLWRGVDWRQDSLVSQPQWIQKMLEQLKCSIYIIHSWTKIWSCPGIRLGSMVCPSSTSCLELKKHQVPWSLNIAALAFLSAAIADKEYLRQTWDLTLSWRRQTVDKITCLFPHWRVYGERWLSWLWVDTGKEEEAAEAVRLAKAAGVPVRNGAMGYEKPTFIRIAVRSVDSQTVLFRALAQVGKNGK